MLTNRPSGSVLDPSTPYIHANAVEMNLDTPALSLSAPLRSRETPLSPAGASVIERTSENSPAARRRNPEGIEVVTQNRFDTGAQTPPTHVPPPLSHPYQPPPLPIENRRDGFAAQGQQHINSTFIQQFSTPLLPQAPADGLDIHPPLLPPGFHDDDDDDDGMDEASLFQRTQLIRNLMRQPRPVDPQPQDMNASSGAALNSPQVARSESSTTFQRGGSSQRSVSSHLEPPPTRGMETMIRAIDRNSPGTASSLRHRAAYTRSLSSDGQARVMPVNTSAGVDNNNEQWNPNRPSVILEETGSSPPMSRRASMEELATHPAPNEQNQTAPTTTDRNSIESVVRSDISSSPPTEPPPRPPSPSPTNYYHLPSRSPLLVRRLASLRATASSPTLHSLDQNQTTTTRAGTRLLREGPPRIELTPVPTPVLERMDTTDIARIESNVLQRLEDHRPPPIAVDEHIPPRRSSRERRGRSASPYINPPPEPTTTIAIDTLRANQQSPSSGSSPPPTSPPDVPIHPPVDATWLTREVRADLAQLLRDTTSSDEFTDEIPYPPPSVVTNILHVPPPATQGLPRLRSNPSIYSSASAAQNLDTTSLPSTPTLPFAQPRSDPDPIDAGNNTQSFDSVAEALWPPPDVHRRMEAMEIDDDNASDLTEIIDVDEAEAETTYLVNYIPPTHTPLSNHLNTRNRFSFLFSIVFRSKISFVVII